MGVLKDDILRQRRLAIIAIFVVSAVGLIFEITLTRLFSLFFQHHFSFLAVSLAILGLSLGAASAYYLKPEQVRAPRTIVLLLVGLSLAFTVTTFLIAWITSVDSIFPRALLALIPFFLIGLFNAVIFENFRAHSGAFYASDLIGAAFGVVIVLGMLYVWSAFSLVYFLGVFVALLAVLFAGRMNITQRQKLFAWGSFALAVIFCVANFTTGIFDFDPMHIIGAPPDKTMIYILQDESQDAEIIYTGWSPFARVDVVETNDPSSRFVFADGGAGAYMLAYEGDISIIDSYVQTPEYLPFTVGDSTNALVIGAGGGKDILFALHAGAEHITAVEVNPAIIDATRYFSDYNGGVLDLPQVELIEGDARSFVERTDQRYDVIYLNLVYTQAVEPAGQTLVENYIFTEEAFQTYLEHLAPGGRIAIISHNALEASRAALTALQALENMRIPPSQALDNLWMWMYPAADTRIRTSVMIVGRDVLPPPSVAGLNALASSQGMQPLFAPGGEYEVLFESLRNGGTLETYIQADSAYNLAPTTDDQPYFFNLDHGIPPAIRAALTLAVFLAGLLIAIIFIMDAKGRKTEGKRWWAVMGYTIVIGLGFMLVEIPLIQRFQLLLPQPIWSLATVLATLLLSGGLGSLLSQNWSVSKLPTRIAIIGLWIALVSIVYWFVLPFIVESLLPMEFGIRLLGIIVLTAVIGFPMGMPFPSLLRLVGQSQQVPLVWGLNGAFSVLGSTLATVISMQWGFGFALMVGAGCYICLSAIAFWVARQRTEAA